MLSNLAAASTVSSSGDIATTAATALGLREGQGRHRGEPESLVKGQG